MFRHQPPAAMYLPLSNWLKGFGRSTEDEAGFRTALERYLGIKACFTASSGRTALYLLLKALSANHPERRNVLLPAYTCPALVRVILDLGLWPCPIDIHLENFAFDETQLVSRLDESVLAVIHVHPFGITLPIDKVMGLAHAVGAVVIEDAAQAMGALLKGRPVGTMGDFGLYSLGPGKPLSVGGGGVICSNDEAHIQLLQEAWQGLPSQTAGQSLWTLTRMLLIRLATNPRGWWLAARAQVQRWGESPDSWGYKVRPLSHSQNRIGLAQLADLDGVNRRRFENGRQLATQLQDLDFAQVLEIDADAEPIFLRLPILLDTAERRERLYEAFWEANIGAGRLYRYPLTEIFTEIEAPPGPEAAQIAQRLLTLPTHHYLSQNDIGRMIDIFRRMND